MFLYTFLRRSLGIYGLLVAFAFSLPAVAADAALQTKLSPVDVISDGQRITVRLTFKNASNEDLYLLAYETALRGIERDIFIVELDG
jgi:hypothetical protein